ncbi:Phosphoribosyl-ATP pyrophosphohydrolase [Methanonatronarchaeum thermophilum]|uniref:Phosphoribosyl-ATP pyrophosphatase n=1 Tax=Methanonatronarchaeum thermophilum TaxID=1927129 RepID=A0A1Y3GGZ4_9EURY|nr:phosphoribosyl-ATP diphosphatase [Methanonatronarchaeum thermophilum]OUJ18705.1 Phosphoribosyl-ATP pyrophosphohydrolase [Methanonatronarchaeum thermophilum]
MNLEIIEEIRDVIENRKENPKKDSYVNQLLKNEDKILEKIGEESTELIISTKNLNQENKKQEFIHEAADLLFHTILLCQSQNIDFNEVLKELQKRRK